jgi:hypothetical protein
MMFYITGHKVVKVWWQDIFPFHVIIIEAETSQNSAWYNLKNQKHSTSSWSLKTVVVIVSRDNVYQFQLQIYISKWKCKSTYLE